MICDGRLAGQLDDVLAQVGLDDLEAGLLERLVEVDLLGRHRLGLDDRAHAASAAQVDDDAPRVLGVGRPVYLPARRDDLFFELLKVAIEVSERSRPRGARPVAHVVGVDQAVERSRALCCKTAGGTVERGLELHVVERRFGAIIESELVNWHSYS